MPLSVNWPDGANVMQSSANSRVDQSAKLKPRNSVTPSQTDANNDVSFRFLETTGSIPLGTVRPQLIWDTHSKFDVVQYDGA